MAAKLSKKDIDLLPFLKKKEKKRLRRGTTALLVAACTLVLLLFLGAFFYLREYRAITARITSAQQYLNDTSFEAAAAQEAFLAFTSLRAQSQYLEDIVNDIASYPVYTSAEYTTLYRLAGTEIAILRFEYAKEANTFSLTAGTNDVEALSLFVEALRESGIFSAIDYTGYMPGADEQLDGLRYSARIVCALKGGDGDV